MTREEADEILMYVAQEIISPYAFDVRMGSEIWGEMASTKFNELCKFVNEKVKENENN